MSCNSKTLLKIVCFSLIVLKISLSYIIYLSIKESKFIALIRVKQANNEME